MKMKTQLYYYLGKTIHVHNDVGWKQLKRWVEYNLLPDYAEHMGLNKRMIRYKIKVHGRGIETTQYLISFSFKLEGEDEILRPEHIFNPGHYGPFV